MDNPFLEANLKRINDIDRRLLELDMMGSYQDVPIPMLRSILKGMVNEISKLEGEVKELRKLVNILKVTEKKDDPQTPKTN